MESKEEIEKEKAAPLDVAIIKNRIEENIAALKNFKEKHEEDLSTVKRTLEQMIQKTETNIAWMEKNYEESSLKMEQITIRMKNQPIAAENNNSNNSNNNNNNDDNNNNN